MKTVVLVSKQRVALDVCVVRVIVEKRVQVIPKKYMWRIVFNRSPENTRWDRICFQIKNFTKVICYQSQLELFQILL